MPTMTQTALSDCSYPESTSYDIREEIEATITRLKVVIDEEASLRKALRTLFVKRREEAIEQVRLANSHLHLVDEEEAKFCEDLKQATAIANEKSNGSGSLANVGTGNVPTPTFSPMPIEAPRNDRVPSKLHASNQGSPQIPERFIHDLTDDANDDTAPPRGPGGSTPGFDTIPLPKSPTKSREAKELADEQAHIADDIRAHEEARKALTVAARRALITAMGERRKAETEKLRLDQEESDRLVKLEADRLADLVMQKQAEEEAGCLARMIAALEARRAEAVQKRLDDERLAKEEDERIAAETAAKKTRQAAARIVAIKRIRERPSSVLPSTST